MYKRQAVRWLQVQDPAAWRLTTYDPAGSAPLNANVPWLHGLQDVRGYDSIIPRQYTEYMAVSYTHLDVYKRQDLLV